MDSDSVFAVKVALIGGALGSLVERLATHLRAMAPLASHEQWVFLQSKGLELAVYLVIAGVVTLAAIMLFPINRQNRPQLIGTAIVFGMVWPSILDRLRALAPGLLGQ